MGKAPDDLLHRRVKKLEGDLVPRCVGNGSDPGPSPLPVHEGDFPDVFLGGPVLERMGPGGVRSDHSPDLAGLGRGGIGREKISAAGENVGELFEDNPRTRLDPSLVEPLKADPVHAGEGHGNPGADGGSRQVCSRRPGGQGDPVPCRKGEQPLEIVGAFGQDNGPRIDPVDSRIVGVGLSLHVRGEDLVAPQKMAKIGDQARRKQGRGHGSKTLRAPSPRGVRSTLAGSDPPL